MFYLTRRQARAAMVGAAAAATYLFASEVAGAKPVKATGLFITASLAMAGMAGSAISSQASVKAYTAHARLDNFFNNGGSVGGDFHVNGDHYATGQMIATGAITTNSGGIFSTGGQVNSNGGALNLSGGNINSPGSVGPWNGNQMTHTTHASATLSSLQSQLNVLLDRLGNCGLMA